MNKLRNKKGFTMIEFIFAFGFLTSAMVVTQFTLTNIINVNNENAKRHAEVISYTSDFEAYVTGVLTQEDVNNLSNTNITVLRDRPSTSSFDQITIDMPTRADQSEYYYRDGTHNLSSYSVNVHTFIKNDAPDFSPYYFVISN